jgi:hypothetical protein
MKFDCAAFNTYLVLGLVLLEVGCATSEEGKLKSQKSVLGVFLQARHPDKDRTMEVTVNRTSPVRITVDKGEKLNEVSLVRAEVVKDLGDSYSIKLQFDRHGTWYLEDMSASNVGRHLAILGKFDEVDRWLAAPIIPRRIGDGVLVFTPDASLEESERFVRGLNNVVEKAKKQSRFQQF